ncbi:hypothetical protein GOC74_08935 [Halomicrobium mukohataei]|uniref:Uncharacterized protein n=1 Tax=Halomicrobium mukohataei TaxID=57705 RepID=A0A847TVK7_9EURY|nr:hypothetical protein [Halomicrobium mukohataei]NLV10052.1 hypothetical protein [Halomicrobium mukohataei]
MTATNSSPPEDIPDSVVTALQDSDDGQLREIIHYAQQLLGEHPSITDAIESREGEELVRTEDHGAYTIAVVKRPDETGEARGPFTYRVRWAPPVEDEDGGGKYHWHYLGRVHGDSEGKSRD